MAGPHGRAGPRRLPRGGGRLRRLRAAVHRHVQRPRRAYGTAGKVRGVLVARGRAAPAGLSAVRGRAGAHGRGRPPGAGRRLFRRGPEHGLFRLGHRQARLRRGPAARPASTPAWPRTGAPSRPGAPTSGWSGRRCPSRSWATATCSRRRIAPGCWTTPAATACRWGASPWPARGCSRPGRGYWWVGQTTTRPAIPPRGARPRWPCWTRWPGGMARPAPCACSASSWSTSPPTTPTATGCAGGCCG